MGPAIYTMQTLAADQPVASSVVPVDITGFTFVLGAAKRICWQVTGLFTLGATGGFRFLANGPAAVTIYNAQFRIRDITTPATFETGQIAEAAFANASAVASTYTLNASGMILNGATAGNFSFQFAQNTSDVLPITILAGCTMKLWQY